MTDVNHSTSLYEQDINELSQFFDLLAKFDFEDMKVSCQSQEVNKDFSLVNGKSLLVSCDDEQIR